MLCDAFARLARIERLSDYRYVGFGSLSFADFALFHRRLGFREMVSIERRETARSRFEFNRPYACVEIKWGEASDRLREIDWTAKRSVVWLDYDGALDRQVLGDTSHVVAHVRSGSMVVVTVCADPGQEGADVGAPERRLTSLVERIGADRMPPDVKAGDLSKWGLARVCRVIIEDAVKRTLNDRNGPLPPEERLFYRQLFNFHYADGARMLTVGGVLLAPQDEERLPLHGLDDLAFIRASAEPYLIQVPVLTLRETIHLDKALPPSGDTAADVAWLPENERQLYEQIYRYSPTFIDAEL
jgi:hypothetical protein